MLPILIVTCWTIQLTYNYQERRGEEGMLPILIVTGGKIDMMLILSGEEGKGS